MDQVEKAIAVVKRWRGDAEVVQVSQLLGGMSAEMSRVELASGERVVVRILDEYLKGLFADPAAQEFRTLQYVRAHGMPAPEPLFAGDGELILSYLPGASTASPTDVSAYLRQFAAQLVAIHRMPAPDFLMPSRMTFERREGELNAELREPETVEFLEAAGPQSAPAVFRHGDFWPGNVLWEDGQLTGVIDWENALSGPAIADLAISRLDVAWVFGFEAMEEFTARYLEAAPLEASSLPYWDLRAALRPMGDLPAWAAPYPALGRPDVTPEHLEAVLLEFVDRAFRRHTRS